MADKGFYTRTQSGITAHVLGDRNMSCETLTAIHTMIEKANEKTINKMDNANFKHALILVAEGEHAVLKIEISKGKWVTLITERLDSPFSHIIEPAGITEACKSA